MAKHRSKKNRIRAEERRLSQLEAQAPILEKNKIVSKVGQKNNLSVNIFTYDPKLILKDLRKTVLLVFFILLVLLAIALIYT